MSADARPDPREELEDFEEVVGSLAQEVREIVRELVVAEPILSMCAAAAVGFTVGGGLPRGSLSLFMEVGARMATRWLQQSFIERADAQEDES